MAAPTNIPIVHNMLAAAGAANAALTLTIPAPGSGFRVYLLGIYMARSATAALAGGAVLTITTTNLPGGPSWKTGNLMAAGETRILVDWLLGASPIRCNSGTATTTFVMPVPGAAVSWSAIAQWMVLHD